MVIIKKDFMLSLSNELDERLDPSIDLPRNINAEQRLLSALLVNNNSLDQIADLIFPDHFYQPLHGRIYGYIINLIDRQLVADHRSIIMMFEKDPAFAVSSVTADEYIRHISSLEFTAVNIKDYAIEIYNHALKRNLFFTSKKISEMASDGSPHYEAKEKLQSAEQMLFELASEGISGNQMKHYKVFIKKSLDTIRMSYNNDRGITGVSTGYMMLDKYLCGLQNSDLLILAGRPSMGKTAFAVNIAMNAAASFYNMHQAGPNKDEKQKSVAFFSLEMSSEQLCTRIISMQSRINSENIRKGFSDSNMEQLIRASKQLELYNLYIDDTPALTISALRTRVRRACRQNNVGLVVVDYLQLLRGSAGSEKNRVQEVSEITQGLKAIAKEMNVPVIALSQLSRAVEQREDKRPLLSDLRESGSIEQDADVVMFIYRDAYYKRRMKDSKLSDTELLMLDRECDILIAKQRNGPIGDVKLNFNPSISLFANYGEYPESYNN